MIPTLRRALRTVGLASLAVSLACFSGSAISAVPWSDLPRLIPTLAAVEVPSPAPPAPKRRKFLGEGPIVISGRGGIDIGSRRSSRDAVVQSQSNYGGTMSVDLERRTDRTAVTISQGIGLASGGATVGQLQLGYRTPDYTAEYGQIAGPAQTQLQIGGFVRGLRFSRPRPDGGLEFLLAGALGSQGQGYTAAGIRWTKATSRSEFALTGLRAQRQQGYGSNTIGAMSYRRFGVNGTSVLEVALSNPNGSPDLPDGVHPAFAFSRDLAFRHGYAQVRFIDVPTGFASLNGSQLPGNTFDFTVRREAGIYSTGLSVQRTQTNQAGSRDTTSRETLQVGRGGTSGAMVTMSLTTDDLNGARTTTRSAGLTLAQSVKHITLSETLQSAQVSGPGGTSATTGLSLAAGRTFGSGYLQLSLGAGSSRDDVNLSSYRQEQLTFTRAIGKKLDLTTSLVHDTQSQNGVRASVDTATLGVIRRLSSAVSLRVAYEQSISHGVTTSRGNAITFDLVGPLAFGASSRTDQRGNPRMPAVVRGHVFVLGGADITAAAAQQRGLGNALIVLDNTVTQRTDATGSFEFRFVKPGVHTVTIESGSLPAGYIVDRRSETVRAVGGGVSTVDFGVGRFAGVGGRIYAAGPNGPHGLPGLTVSVDNTYRSVTDADGRWSIGRLSPGTHRVVVSTENAPTSVAFSGPPESTVQVVNGVVTSVDFVAQTLGSISGQVVSADPNDASKLTGVRDVYVVANPGDHAAITDGDGSYIIDNLLPGTYTVAVDKETLPEGAGPNEPYTAVLGASQHLENVVLRLSAEEKNVVFTFKGGKKSQLVATFDPPHAPPGALVRATVTADAGVTGPIVLEADLLKRMTLTHDASGAWTAAFVLPPTAHGEMPVQFLAHGASVSSVVTVDPTIPLVGVRSIPSRPQPNRPLHLSLRIYAPVEPGDIVRFDDAPSTRLPKPHGRTYELDIRTGPRGILNGTILAKNGRTYDFTVR